MNGGEKGIIKKDLLRLLQKAFCHPERSEGSRIFLSFLRFFGRFAPSE
jgi:hypothetical protein